MVSGTLCIIGCPILEDEIIYSLRTDPDEKNVYLIDSPPAHTLKKKLELNGIPFVSIDEWDFDKGFYEIEEKKFNVIVIMNKLGLHSRPDELRRTIEEQMRWYRDRFDAIALYYGMCGNAGWDVSKWASKILSIPVFVFRDRKEEVCDDCIGVAVGGHSEYYAFVRKYTGMLFVTPAIAENWDDFAKEMNMLKGFDVLGIHSVKEMFALFGYKNMVRLDTGIGISGGVLDKSFQHISEITGLLPVTAAPGSADMYPTERLYKDAKGSLRQ
ncbi:MAG: DUF1638 domain-containing protein [Methanomassiliicoccaceae archaeon]|jgi:hypothetical protein|nr:DUF1638 domain-containing protein [Methanomassiliicoccaceae archaeon]